MKKHTEQKNFVSNIERTIIWKPNFKKNEGSKKTIHSRRYGHMEMKIAKYLRTEQCSFNTNPLRNLKSQNISHSVKSTELPRETVRRYWETTMSLEVWISLYIKRWSVMTKWDLFWEFRVNLIYENQAVIPDVAA